MDATTTKTPKEIMDGGRGRMGKEGDVRDEAPVSVGGRTYL
jgi:hypothetical protein